MTTIRSAAVLGAGVMGAQIAAHLANAGVPVRVLDLTADAARQGVDRLKTLRPDPWFASDVRSRVQPAGLDALSQIAGADWIIEAIVEDVSVKRDLLARAAGFAPRAVLSSNTSGIPIAAIAEGLPADARSRLLGTHFFNPPRYLPLVEVIPTRETDPTIVSRLSYFLDHRLGKGVVVAHDTPGFIANRLGVFGACRALALVASGDASIEEIDALTGPLIGRPKSATFRTLDVAGLDIFSTVARDLATRLPDEAADFALPEFVGAMLARGLTGDKAGRGFYTRDAAADGARRVLVIDPATLEYRERAPESQNRPDAGATTAIGETLRARFLARDRAGDLLRRLLGSMLVYAATIGADIADTIDDVDRAMRWGFGWALGPFETWDAIGVDAVLASCEIAQPPPLVTRLRESGRDRFRATALGPADPGRLVLQTARRSHGVVKSNAGTSLIDLGDGVLAIEFHSKMNVIGGETIEMIRAGLEEASKQTALVIGSEAEVFSAGANLMLLLLEAQEGNWDEVDLMVRAFQQTTMAIKTSAVPVVAAPAGLTLGGGCEICLHAERIRAAAETYMGLVEAGVGLIPAGGGTKEVLLRVIDRAAGGDLLPHLRSAFETIARGRVSTSALDARRLGYLRGADDLTMNRERVIADAKAVALERARGYRPVAPRQSIPVGGDDQYAVLALGVHLAWRAGQASDHDALVGRTLARVLTGGTIPHATTVTEEHLLDLEREAFLALCGERKTLERIGYTLKTGKTLRN